MCSTKLNLCIPLRVGVNFWRSILVLTVYVFLYTTYTLAVTQKTLYAFQGGTDGAYPATGLFMDSKGNLYGVTTSGGNNECNSILSSGCGTVFQLSLDGKGSWKEKVIHIFEQSSDGGDPSAAPVMDSSSNLYGTTLYYGPFSNGVIWQLIPSSNGKWSENILHSFTGGNDGFWCYGMSFDRNGHLFGTTYAGGTTNNGVVFHLEQNKKGKWNDSILYDFQGGTNDGDSPSDAPTFAADGKIYGTTYEGGPHLTGTVFEMRHTSQGWQEAPIYIFQGLPFSKGSDGTNPVAGVVLDGSGNLYGTADYGGKHAVGTVYELSPDGKGGWTEKILHTFTDSTDGGHPGGLIMDSAGNLYGLTSGHNTAGSVFELSPRAHGKWKFTVLYDFQGGSDGSNPSGSLVRDTAGHLFGTTSFAGANGFGTIFEIVP